MKKLLLCLLPLVMGCAYYPQCVNRQCTIIESGAVVRDLLTETGGTTIDSTAHGSLK